MGARPLRRALQDKVEDRLSDAVLAHDFKDGDNIIVDVNKEKEIVLKRGRRKAASAKKETVKEAQDDPEEVPA
jgi:ATP-dependent Clp protease ATP-binding subunit ClpC